MTRLRRLVALQLVGARGRLALPPLVIVLGGLASLLATWLDRSVSPIAEPPDATWWVMLAATASLATSLGWALVPVTTFWHFASTGSGGVERGSRVGVPRRQGYLVGALTGTLLAAGYTLLVLLGALAATILAPADVGIVEPATRLDDLGRAVGPVAEPAEIVAFALTAGAATLASAATGLVVGTLWRRWQGRGVAASAAVALLAGLAVTVADAREVWLAGVLAGLPAPAVLAVVAVALGAVGFLLLERPRRGTGHRSVRLPRRSAAQDTTDRASSTATG